MLRTERVNNAWDRFWYMVMDVFGHREDPRALPGSVPSFHFLGVRRTQPITTAIVFLQADVIWPIWHVWFMQGGFYLGLSLVCQRIRARGHCGHTREAWPGGIS